MKMRENRFVLFFSYLKLYIYRQKQNGGEENRFQEYEKK